MSRSTPPADGDRRGDPGDDRQGGRQGGRRAGQQTPTVLDLGLGHPEDALLPHAMVREAVAAALQGGPLALQYGAEQGDADFRRAIAGFVERQAGRAVDPARLFATAGASVALSLACTLWTRPGDAVLVEDATYHLALRMFHDQHLEVVALPGHGPRDGAWLDALQRTLEARNGGAGADGGGRVALLYLVPFFANPTGASLRPEPRRRLLELTAEHGVTVLSDEVYRFLPFDGEPPASLAGPDAPHVLALNSFSKILAPGLRLGWLEGSPEALARVERSGLLQSGGGLNPFTAAAILPLLRSGALDAHLARLRATYRERAGALTAALERAVPGARFQPPEGGYFVWLELPGLDTAAFLRAALAEGVRYLPGARFRVAGGASSFARLGFSYYPPAQLEEGARRLGRAVRAAAVARATIDPAP